MYIDLHMHTTASDGAWTRSQLLDLLTKHNITTFSVTDHDTTQNSKPIIPEAKTRGLHCIPGVEISTLHDQEYHITSY
ncbi:MAG: PHP domain-containing protein, partial [Candidatus Latescibacteria bacterium]|nr:PHP domain-containing protein [Candidatus Latescibacterota bacterium]